MTSTNRTAPADIGGPMLSPRRQAAYLLGEWRLMARPRTILTDGFAAVAVALVALPLSLAIANASGVRPEIGLATAVVGGIVAALFGGCRLQVSGPAAAMTFLVLEVVTTHGMTGLIAATLLAGLFQLASGILRLGRFMQFIPRPVIAGFLSGIGLTILCTQAPVILGYSVLHSNEEGGALALLWKTGRQIGQTEPTSLAVGLVAAGSMILLPRISRKLPTPLIAVGIATVLPWALGWSRVELLGPLPAAFPRPDLPVIPWGVWNELVMASLTIFFLASIESLLSASVVDSMAKQSRVDNDQELFGQGLANVCSAFFGGIPVTGVIARSATNIQAGGRTRLSAILHALIILAMMLVLGPLVSQIPKAALAGVLVAVALRMIEIHKFRALWRGSRAEALVFLVTAGAIIVTDLIDGVQIGLLATVFYFVYEMSDLSLRPVSLADDPEEAAVGEAPACPMVTVMEVEGPLFFASGFHLRSVLNRMNGGRCLVLDLGGASLLDITGAELLEECAEVLRGRGVTLLLTRPSPAVRHRLRGLERSDFPSLAACPVYDDLRDAILHAATLIGTDHLCGSCREVGRCAILERALQGIESSDQTPVPHVRAVIADDAGPGDGDRAASASRLAPGYGIRRDSRPSIHPGAVVAQDAILSGPVYVGERAAIGPGTTIQAEEGSPFLIGEGAILQIGVTVATLRDRLILVGGRPFAVYIGRDARLAHHALIGGPCYLGDRCRVGFKATVHDAVVGEGCVIGLGAIVVGVSIPAGSYVAHNLVVDTQEKADALPPVEAEADAEAARRRDDLAKDTANPSDGTPRSLQPTAGGEGDRVS